MKIVHTSAALLLLAATAPASALTVGASAAQCDFTSLQAAVDAVPPGRGSAAREILIEGGYQLDESVLVRNRNLRIVRALGRNCSTANPIPDAVILTGEFAGEAALTVFDSTVTIEGFDFANNVVDDTGDGAVAASDSEITFRRTTFRGNVSRGHAPIELTRTGIYRFIDTTLINNRSLDRGAGVLDCEARDQAGSSISVNFSGDTRINGNISAQDGGALAAGRSCTITVTGTPAVPAQLRNNTAARDGGAIAVNGRPAALGRITLQNAELTDNDAGRNGGAIAIGRSDVDGLFLGTGTITASLIGNNDSNATGGAIGLVGEAEDTANEALLIDATRIVDNNARTAGGAIHAVDHRVTMTGCNSLDLPGGRYCSELRDNIAGVGIGGGSAGTLTLISARALIDRTAIIGSEASRDALVGDLQRSGRLVLTSSLVTGSSSQLLPVAVPLFRLRGGSTATFAFDTITDNRGEEPFRLDDGTRVLAAATIALGNDTPQPQNGVGELVGGCNAIAFAGAAPLPDPRFTVTDRGPFRPSAESPLRNAAIPCGDLTDPGEVLEGLVVPNVDLDGQPRRTAGVTNPFEVDIGAFEFIEAPRGDDIFASSFEDSLK